MVQSKLTTLRAGLPLEAEWLPLAGNGLRPGGLEWNVSGLKVKVSDGQGCAGHKSVGWSVPHSLSIRKIDNFMGQTRSFSGDSFQNGFAPGSGSQGFGQASQLCADL